jgi:hypothetical protein
MTEKLRITRECAEAWERSTGLTGIVKAAVEAGYWEIVEPKQQGAASCKA